MIVSQVEPLVKWSDWRRRRKELIDKARYFKVGIFPSLITSAWIEHLATLVEKKTPRAELERAFDKTIRTWKIEHSRAKDIMNDGMRILRKRRLNELENLLLGKGGEVLEKEIERIMPSIQELVRNYWNLMPLWTAFMPFVRKKDRRMHFFSMCYGYPLYVEGIFDEVIRLLYILISTNRRKSISPKTLQVMTLQDFRNGFLKLGFPGIFFHGWNRHIRNSISHCRFRYSERSGKVLFTDADRRGKTTYHVQWSLERFGELSSNLQDVWTIFQNLLYLLRIRQLILAPDVPRAGKDLIMPRLSGKERGYDVVFQ